VDVGVRTPEHPADQVGHAQRFAYHLHRRDGSASGSLLKLFFFFFRRRRDVYYCKRMEMLARWKAI
jgi:hypothetical protein